MNGAKVIIHSANIIGLTPGSYVTSGGEMDVYIQNYNCTDALYRTSNNSQSGGKNNNAFGSSIDAVQMQQAPNIVSAQKTMAIKVYPNPSNGMISIERESEEPINIIVSDVNGKIVYIGNVSGSITNLDLNTIQNGVYLLQAGSNKFKLMIVK